MEIKTVIIAHNRGNNANENRESRVNRVIGLLLYVLINKIK